MSFKLKDFMNEVKPESLLPNYGTPISFKVTYASFGSTKGQEADPDQGKKARAQRPVLKAALKVTSHSNIKKIRLNFYRPVEGEVGDWVDDWNQDLIQFLHGIGYNVAKDGELPDFIPGMESQELPGFKGKEGYARVKVGESLSGEEENQIIDFLDKEEYERYVEAEKARS